MGLQAPSISEILGPDVARYALRDTMERLADQMLAHHWHVDQLPWGQVPLFPISADTNGARVRKLARFYKSVVAVQTKAEEIAVSIARQLLLAADEARLHVSFRRALSALLNDEASHVATMVKIESLADEMFPDIMPRPEESPLFVEMRAIENLEPALLATVMAFYEASVAIRSYAEEQTYKVPSILGAMASRAAEDDGRHAKTLRLVAYEFLSLFRSRYGDDDGASQTWRAKFLDPLRRLWSLMPAHEFYLAGNDKRQLSHVRRLLDHDTVIISRILNYLGVSEKAQGYACTEAVSSDI